MKSLFDIEAKQEIFSRLEKLTEKSQRKWGKMNVAQMLSHCQCAPLVALGKMAITKPSFFLGIVLRLCKGLLYNDTPWGRGMPTAKEFVVTEGKDFEEEREKLLRVLEEFYRERERREWNPHPVFGHFTKEQWGQMQYKHLDHHLKQFGV